MPRIGLSMIVRDEAKTLSRCLQSVSGIVDEIVVGDTGSQDGSPSIAEAAGARVIEVPWTKDFAAARNRVLAEMKCDWVLILDADEILDPAAAVAFSSLPDAKVAGYQVPIRNYVLSLEDRIWDRPARPNNSSTPETQGYPAYVDHENVRLFRKDPRIYFVGRVHESVGPRIEEVGLRIAHATFLIHHFGLAANAETRARKNRAYRELGRQKVLDMPRNAQAHLELGLVELDNFGNLVQALQCFQRACELNPKLGVAWFFAGHTHARLEEYGKALQCLKRAKESGHETQVVAEAIGDVHYNLGEFHEALSAYRRALEFSSQCTPAESKLGMALCRTGFVAEGTEKIRTAVQRRPQSGELHDRLIQMLVWQERLKEAAEAAENKLRNVPGIGSADFLRAATLWFRQGDWPRATAILHVGKQLHPDPILDQALVEMAVGQEAGVNQVVTALHNMSTVPRRN